MTSAILILLAGWFVAQLVWTGVQVHLILALRDFFPELHSKTGAPSATSLIQMQRWNPKWHWFVLSGQFKHSCPAVLATSFRIARLSGWVAIGLFAIFLCLVASAAVGAWQ